VKAGFTPYGALTYFIFYGYDHLVDPLITPPVEKPGLAWRLLSGLTRAVMGHSGEPEPVMEKRAKRTENPTMVDDDELRARPLIAVSKLARRGEGATS
jgi:hypothetical protein